MNWIELRRVAFASAKRWLWVAVILLPLTLSGCDGKQSALAPAGKAAEQIATVFWWMVAGGVVIWLIVGGLAIYASFVHVAPRPRRAGLLIIGGGALIPTVVLTVLLSYGLALLPDLVRPAPEGSQRITVVGEQWWWRVRYRTEEGDEIELANEIHLPVGEPVEFVLESADVIHAFWIPSLGGKVDMIPGRANRLSLEATKTGVFRGVCAEYCGSSHALMAFDVVVEEREAFEAWLAQQAAPAVTPENDTARAGQEVFRRNGCGACHTIRGTAARGVLGPDLTHVGSRLTLAAGTFPQNPEALVDWIACPDCVKPDALMPHFGMLPAKDQAALAAYLGGLK